jgi:hypothetical protein
MLDHLKEFRLGKNEIALLQETARVMEPLTSDAAMPDAASRDLDEFHRRLAAGTVFFTRQGYAKMKTIVDHDANTYPEALVNLPDADLI